MGTIFSHRLNLVINELHCIALQDNEALGVQTRPDGHTKAQKAHLKQQVDAWCEALRTQKIRVVISGGNAIAVPAQQLLVEFVHADCYSG